MCKNKQVGRYSKCLSPDKTTHSFYSKGKKERLRERERHKLDVSDVALCTKASTFLPLLGKL